MITQTQSLSLFLTLVRGIVAGSVTDLGTVGPTVMSDIDLDLVALGTDVVLVLSNADFNVASD